MSSIILAGSLLPVSLASISLLYTHYIQVDRNCYHPLHLLLLQLATFFLSTLHSSGISDVTRDTSPPLVVARSKTLWISLITLSLSLPLFAQAIVHFNHMTTVALLISLTLLAENIVARILASRARRQERICGIIAVLLTFLLVLFEEYKLTVNGLLFGLFALGFAAIGKSLLLVVLRKNVSHGDGPGYLTWFAVIRILISFAFVVTLTWGMVVEDTLSAIESFVRINPLHIVLNVALVSGCLITGSTTAQRLHRDPRTDLSTASTLFMFAGLTSLAALLMPRRTYSSCWQTAVFICIFALSFFRGWHSPGASHIEEEVDAQCFGDQEQGHANSHVSSSSDPEARSTDGMVKDSENAVHYKDDLRGNRMWMGTRSRGNSYMASAFGIWCVFSYLNFSLDTRASLHNRYVPTLDRTYHPGIDLDIVLNMYDEGPASVASMVSGIRSLPNIANKTTRVLIYYKGEDRDDAALNALKHQTGATELIQLLNVGREAEGYLHHIISRYDDLAKHTLFMQAHVHNSWELKRRIGHYFIQRTGMLNLGFSEVCDCDDCWDRHGWHDDISRVYQSVYNGTCTSALLSYKGQFIVSSRRIRGLNRSIYTSLRDALVDPASWAHQEPYLRARKDSMSAPQFGYTLERMWSILFQCSELDIMDKCPTLLSGTRSGGERADCQCLDGALVGVS